MNGTFCEINITAFLSQRKRRKSRWIQIFIFTKLFFLICK